MGIALTVSRRPTGRLVRCLGFTVLTGMRGLKTSMPPTPLTFAAFGSKPKVVDLAALTVLTGDARLALTLATVDVTLSIGGTQSVAVTPNK